MKASNASSGSRIGVAVCVWTQSARGHSRPVLGKNVRTKILKMGPQIGILDIKLLWGRAGGRCSAPKCNEDLTTLMESGGYVIGEMAHVIGRKPSARRGKSN